MVRSGATLSTLLILLSVLLAPPPALVAQVPGGEERVHTVEPGQTLSGIALEYYGNSAGWTEILDANRDQISDPAQLRVGMELVIPGVPRQARVVERVHVPPPEGPEAEAEGAAAGIPAGQLEAVRQRQALARYGSFEPAPPPAYTGERTVFFDPPGLAAEGMTIEGWRPEDVPAFPEEVFRASGWLLRPNESFQPLGRITSFAGDQDIRLFRTTLQHRDLVRGEFEGDRRPEVGERFLVVKEGQSIDEVGTVIRPTGRVIVRRVVPAGAVLELVNEYDRVELGHYLLPDRTSPVSPGVEAEPTDEWLEARILAFEREREIQLRNDRAFLDVGRAEGVRPGDEFVLLLGEEEGWDGRVVARLQVLDVRETTSTARLLYTTSREVRSGLPVRLQRRMP